MIHAKLDQIYKWWLQTVNNVITRGHLIHIQSIELPKRGTPSAREQP